MLDDGDHVFFFTNNQGSQKARDIPRDGRVAPVKLTGKPFPIRGNVVSLIAVDHSSLTELPFEDAPA